MDETEIAQNLLSKHDLHDLLSMQELLKTEVKPCIEKHALISKYRERLWFQKAMRMTPEQLKAEYQTLAKIIEGIEGDITDIRRKVYMHSVATEALHKSKKPFVHGLELIQQSLF